MGRGRDTASNSTRRNQLHCWGDSLLQWRIFPRARNRKSETSFPPMHCSASPPPFSLDRFFPCVFLEAALPSNTATHFSFFVSDSPLSDEKLRHIRQLVSLMGHNSKHDDPTHTHSQLILQSYHLKRFIILKRKHCWHV